MRRHSRTLLIALTCLGVSAGFAGAQFIVFDALTTAKNAVIAGLKEQLLETLTNESSLLKRMARRLSLLTDLAKYVLPDPPRWRTHPIDGDQFLFAYPFTAALNYGDSGGGGYARVSRDREMPGAEVAALQTAAPDAYKAILAALATLDLADSTLIAGTDQTGQLRFNGRTPCWTHCPVRPAKPFKTRTRRSKSRIPSPNWVVIKCPWFADTAASCRPSRNSLNPTSSTPGRRFIK